MPETEKTRSPRTGRLRVLVMTSTFPRWAGDHQPTFVQDLAEHIEGFDQTILAPASPGAPMQETTASGLRIRRFRYAPLRSWELLAYDGGMLGNVTQKPWLLALLPGFLLSMLFHVLSLHRRYGFDLIHAHWIVPQGFIAALARSLMINAPPLLITAHGADVYSFFGPVGTWCKRFALKRASGVTAVSHVLKRDILALTPDLKIMVAPMGIYLSSQHAPRHPKEGFCFVGRLVDKKGVLDLIDVIGTLHKRLGPQCPQFHIAGDGPLRSQVEARIKELKIQDIVQLYGWLDRIRIEELICSRKALIMPSHTAHDGDREGLGLVAIEALALGTHVIAYDFEAVADIQAMCSGITVIKEGDLNALAASIETTDANMPAPFSKQPIRQYFGWESRASEYGKGIYRRLIKEKGW